ncbi:glycosyltransferase involved in cell wall biosynthesis [Kroppenstedtia sanguinis]|uniref:Glycosyltransferase family 4 protein n=1 Tax=Kroppenstedtia sanguinis TaxID=1380684 RepID=A0ABW4CBG1_9BACL
MRIWIANHYAAPPHLGGITRHYELAQEWAAEEQAEVTLWLSSFNHTRRRRIRRAERDSVKTPGFRLRWLWSFPHTRNDFRRVLNMISFSFLFVLVGCFRRRPDLLLASSPHLLTPLAGWVLSKVKRCPFVLEVRDLWPDTLIQMNGLRNPLVIKALTRLESFLYRRADQIIVLTEYQRKFIAAKGIPSHKISLIPNGIVQGSWHPRKSEKREYRRRMGVESYRFVALYAGAHGPANALEHVVQAALDLPTGCAIVLIGDGPEKERLRQLKRERGLDHVYLLDPVPKEEIYHYIDAADCGVISLADHEIFRGARPNKLFDYLYVGKPVITTVDGEVRQIVEENGVGLFSGAENSRGLAEAIEKLMTLSPEERERIAEQGQRYIERFGDRRKLAKKLLREMKSLLYPGAKPIEEINRSG